MGFPSGQASERKQFHENIQAFNFHSTQTYDKLVPQVDHVSHLLNFSGTTMSETDFARFRFSSRPLGP